MKQPEQPQLEKPYGGMTREEWAAKIQAAKTSAEVMALAILAPRDLNRVPPPDFSTETDNPLSSTTEPEPISPH